VKCDPAECSDGELAALSLAGRQDAFAEIIRRHREPVYRLIRGYTGNPEEALDLVQDTFISAFKHLDRYDQSRPFRPWLARIAINKCRDWSRRRAVRRIFLLDFAASDAIGSVPDPHPGADDSTADRQELDLLWTAVSRLPRSLKEPLILRTIDGLSQAETAAALGISEKAVETRIYRARRSLSGFRTSNDPKTKL
jgi:RNA polymerase sigma-70 factor (ECF subfamily)